jgi:glycosyltransferase involved in cell wall biosynthesis
VKVLFVINSLGTGGAERSLAETLTAVPSTLEPVVVCLDRTSQGVQQQVLASGFDVRFVTGSIAHGARELRAVISDVVPDLVHTSIFEADITGRFAAINSGVPVVTSLVNTSYDPARKSDPSLSSWKLGSARALEGWTARHLTAHFHAITHAVKSAAVRDLHVDPAFVTVIERGRDPERLGEPSAERRATARAALGLDSDSPVLVTVGRQEFQKGQWILIEALAKVRAAFPDVRLLVAGRRGNASARLERAIEDAGVGSAVDLLGHRGDVPDLIAAADVFVFPSLYEGLGGALIEAMALALPIVASDLPATREVLEPSRNADLVSPNSSSDLADAVVALLADPGRRSTYAARGRAIFEDRFTLKRSTTRMLDLFERVAAAGRHGRIEVV